MAQDGKPLERVQTNTRSMQYAMRSGQTVRVRTCNDHVLVVLASGPEPASASLNIEGTDFLLVVMPETPRTSGPVIAYLIPTQVAAAAVRRAHSEWLASGPNTNGNNTTWNIWFEDHSKSGGFAKHWAQYRLQGEASTLNEPTAQKVSPGPTSKLGNVIAAAKQQIADAAGVPIEAVKISVELG
jgi:hypothetical protein